MLLPKNVTNTTLDIVTYFEASCFIAHSFTIYSVWQEISRPIAQTSSVPTKIDCDPLVPSSNVPFSTYSQSDDSSRSINIDAGVRADVPSSISVDPTNQVHIWQYVYTVHNIQVAEKLQYSKHGCDTIIILCKVRCGRSRVKRGK